MNATVIITVTPLIPVGTIMCATFSIADDNMVEPIESFMVTASGGSFAGRPNSVQVNILDNDSKNTTVCDITGINYMR